MKLKKKFYISRQFNFFLYLFWNFWRCNLHTIKFTFFSYSSLSFNRYSFVLTISAIKFCHSPSSANASWWSLPDPPLLLQAPVYCWSLFCPFILRRACYLNSALLLLLPLWECSQLGLFIYKLLRLTYTWVYLLIKEAVLVHRLGEVLPSFYKFFLLPLFK